jgi:uncharacterized membrane protein
MKSLLKFLQNNIFETFILLIALLTILPILAPILQRFEINFPANLIYTVFKLSCHQFHWRSIHFFDYQVAWCVRDMFIWLGFLATAICVKYNYIKRGLAWYWMIPFTIPIALDGGIQTIATIVGFATNSQFYLATNLTRMITGSIFGIGLGVIISPFLKEESELNRASSCADTQSQKSRTLSAGKKECLFFKLFSVFILLFVLYILFIQIWKVSSPHYPPDGILDDSKREAPNVVEWQQERGAHSIKYWYEVVD